MKIQMYAKVVTEIPNGEMEIIKDGDSYRLIYHNSIYTNSPFKLPMTFSTDFTIEQIISSQELDQYMKRFGALS